MATKTAVVNLVVMMVLFVVMMMFFMQLLRGFFFLLVLVLGGPAIVVVSLTFHLSSFFHAFFTHLPAHAFFHAVHFSAHSFGVVHFAFLELLLASLHVVCTCSVV
jgi:hypothetical protein